MKNPVNVQKEIAESYKEAAGYIALPFLIVPVLILVTLFFNQDTGWF